jgi:hypothetical protein
MSKGSLAIIGIGEVPTRRICLKDPGETSPTYHLSPEKEKGNGFILQH